MENKNTGLKVMVIILCLLVLGLSGYIVYDKVFSEVQETDNNTASLVYDYSNIKGVYGANKTVEVDNNNESASFTLYLWENGTFKYEHSIYAPSGIIGNYVLVNNKIVLNYLFETNSGTGLNITKGSKEIAINEDGTLTDKNYVYLGNSSISITLSRKEENEYFKTNSFYEMVSNADDILNQKTQY